MSARILVVDDDPWILRMVTASLRKRSFTVDTARDGRQALDRVRAHAPDVVVTDVMMPIMDGWAFVKQLRSDPRMATIPVIFLTALGKDQAKLRSMGLSEDDYLTKPFRFDDLEKRVEAALASRASAARSSPSTPPQPHYPQGTNPNSGLHPVPAQPGYPPPGTNPNSGLHPLPVPPPPGYPQGTNPNSGVYPLPAPPPGYPQGTNPNSGVYPLPAPPPGYGQYPPGQYPPPHGQPGPAQYQQYPPGYGQYPGQYPPPPPGQYPYPPGQPGQPGPPGPPATPGGPPPADESVSAPARRGERSRRATGLHGKLEQLGLSSLLVMMEMERKQGVLSLSEQGQDAIGKLFLRGGRVVAAELDSEPDLDGKQCVYRMLAYKAGTFSFSATTVDVEDTVQASTTHLLMEGARLIDEAGRDDEGL